MVEAVDLGLIVTALDGHSSYSSPECCVQFLLSPTLSALYSFRILCYSPMLCKKGPPAVTTVPSTHFRPSLFSFNAENIIILFDGHDSAVWPMLLTALSFPPVLSDEVGLALNIIFDP